MSKIVYLNLNVGHIRHKFHFITFILAVHEAGFYCYFAILKAILLYFKIG